MSPIKSDEQNMTTLRVQRHLPVREQVYLVVALIAAVIAAAGYLTTDGGPSTLQFFAIFGGGIVAIVGIRRGLMPTLRFQKSKLDKRFAGNPIYRIACIAVFIIEKLVWLVLAIVGFVLACGRVRGGSYSGYMGGYGHPEDAERQLDYINNIEYNAARDAARMEDEGR
jgi:hypothetical protein